MEHTKGKTIRFVGTHPEIHGVVTAAVENAIQKKWEFLFFANESVIIHRRDFDRRYFIPDLEKAGIPRVPFHSLRHTFASHFVMAGGSLEELRRLLGHSSTVTTDRYAHFNPHHVRSRVNILKFDEEPELKNVIDISSRMGQRATPN